MQRLVAYLSASIASGIGWKLGSLIGPIAGYFVAILFSAVGFYVTRRWLREAIG